MYKLPSLPSSVVNGVYNYLQYQTVYSDVGPKGFTPFQFSSSRLQSDTTQFGGVVPSNPISSIFSEGSKSWYEMWINPEKVSLSRQFQVREVHTAGSIVAFHYRPQTIKMHVEGAVGWIAKGPFDENSTASLFTNMSSSQSTVGLTSNSSDNSPRIFLKRLRDLAEDPAYYLGTDGVEHYNIKYIKIYTKQYPQGVQCEGYFTKFDVPESGDDAQTITYNFDFTIESLSAITDMKNILGMFS